MSTFSFIPSYSVNLTTKPKVRRAQFGDGYSQRVADGINTQPRVWSLRFNNDAAKLDPIEAFLTIENGVTSFDWAPPTGSAGKFICEEWGRAINGSGDEVVTATFLEVYGE